jgi:hypothetical protein
MTSKLLLVVVVLALPGGAAPSAAQASTVYVGRIGYQSPALVAPIVLVSGTSSETLRWHAGVLGWTLRGGLRYALGNQRHLLGELDVTPRNSNGASYIFRDGELVEEKFFKNATTLGRIGVIQRHSASLESRLFALGLIEQVEHDNRRVNNYWRRPYLGLELQETFQSLNSYDVYLSRWDGYRAEGRAQVFVGDHTWARLRAEAGLGRRHDRLFWMLRGVLLYGHGLNTVNRFLVGGGWEGPGLNDMVGYHYAEFRVSQALVLHGAVDFRVAGDWELGLRSSVMGQTPSDPVRSGVGVRLSTVLDGIGVILGASRRDDALRAGQPAFLVHGALTLGVLD